MIEIYQPPYKKGKSGKRYKYTWTISDSYHNYKEMNGELAIEKKLYVSILSDFFWELSKLIIRKKYEFKIPNRMGFIRIKKGKPADLSKHKLDFKHYNETGKKRYFLNMHTDRNYFFWDWNIKKFRYAFFTNRFYYKFIPNRGNDGVIGKRGLSNWIRKCCEDPTLKDYDVIK